MGSFFLRDIFITSNLWHIEYGCQLDKAYHIWSHLWLFNGWAINNYLITGKDIDENCYRELMKIYGDFKFILLGVIVIFMGIVKTLIPGETFKLGSHPIGMVSIIPGYIIIIIGVAIITIALLAQFMVSRKS